jgi:acyl-CoA thioesterase YciA
MSNNLTCTHRLVLPADTNHHGTLYAGSLLRIALEAAYVTAHRAVGSGANLLLRRVLSLECYRPVPVGSMIEIRGVPLHLTRAYLVVGLVGVPLAEQDGPWMDALLGFVQVDADGQPAPFPSELTATTPADGEWHDLAERMEKLLRVR